MTTTHVEVITLQGGCGGAGALTLLRWLGLHGKWSHKGERGRDVRDGGCVVPSQSLVHPCTYPCRVGELNSMWLHDIPLGSLMERVKGPKRGGAAVADLLW